MNKKNQLNTHIRRDQLLRLIGTEVTSRRGKAALLKACEALREATMENKRLRLRNNFLSGRRKNGALRAGEHAVSRPTARKIAGVALVGRVG